MIFRIDSPKSDLGVKSRLHLAIVGLRRASFSWLDLALRDHRDVAMRKLNMEPVSFFRQDGDGRLIWTLFSKYQAELPRRRCQPNQFAISRATGVRASSIPWPQSVSSKMRSNRARLFSIKSQGRSERAVDDLDIVLEFNPQVVGFARYDVQVPASRIDCDEEILPMSVFSTSSLVLAL